MSNSIRFLGVFILATVATVEVIGGDVLTDFPNCNAVGIEKLNSFIHSGSLKEMKDASGRVWHLNRLSSFLNDLLQNGDSGDKSNANKIACIRELTRTAIAHADKRIEALAEKYPECTPQEGTETQKPDGCEDANWRKLIGEISYVSQFDTLLNEAIQNKTEKVKTEADAVVECTECKKQTKMLGISEISDKSCCEEFKRVDGAELSDASCKDRRNYKSDSSAGRSARCASQFLVSGVLGEFVNQLKALGSLITNFNELGLLKQLGVMVNEIMSNPVKFVKDFIMQYIDLQAYYPQYWQCLSEDSKFLFQCRMAGKGALNGLQTVFAAGKIASLGAVLASKVPFATQLAQLAKGAAAATKGKALAIGSGAIKGTAELGAKAAKLGMPLLTKAKTLSSNMTARFANLRLVQAARAGFKATKDSLKSTAKPRKPVQLELFPKEKFGTAALQSIKERMSRLSASISNSSSLQALRKSASEFAGTMKDNISTKAKLWKDKSLEIALSNKTKWGMTGAGTAQLNEKIQEKDKIFQTKIKELEEQFKNVTQMVSKLNDAEMGLGTQELAVHKEILNALIKDHLKSAEALDSEFFSQLKKASVELNK
jgi:hypothetical protein